MFLYVYLRTDSECLESVVPVIIQALAQTIDNSPP